tara:strand:- start:343 stop:495 length:153 start_codon:yes stop_codon:yes gene_type:complete
MKTCQGGALPLVIFLIMVISMALIGMAIELFKKFENRMERKKSHDFKIEV